MRTRLTDGEGLPPGASGGRRRQWLTLATLCAAPLIATLDTSVVNLAVRPIRQYFDTGVIAVQWVVDGYNLTYAVCLLTSGLLADLYGRRMIFMVGAAVFALASVLCAVAPVVSLLIGARLLTGLGAALMLPASLALVRIVWPQPTQRAKALGFWAGCNGLALAIGPTLGGLLIAAWGWRSIFLVVAAPAVAALGLAPNCLPSSAEPCGRRFDPSGQIWGALALTGIAVAAIESHRFPAVAACALAGARLLLVLFVRAEAKAGAAAMVPVELFKVRPFRGVVTATAGMTFGMYGVLFLLPLTWQSTGTLGPAGAGLALMPMALIFVIVSFGLSGPLSARVGARALMSGGVATIAVGVMMIGATVAIDSLAVTECGLALTGLGMGLATGPLMNTAVGAVSAARAGTAGSLINVARMIGATLGVAVLGALFAATGGGPLGLVKALLLGAVVQLAGAALVWRATLPNPR